MHKSLESSLKGVGFETIRVLNPFDSLNRFEKTLYAKRTIFLLKRNISIINYIRKKINIQYLAAIKEYSPDLIMIYNSQFMMPETLKQLPDHTKVVVFLGDNPYFTPTDPFNLTILPLVDKVYAADSSHVEHMRRIGIAQTELGMLGLDPALYEGIEPTEEERRKYQHDMLFIGMTYPSSWGYKRLYYLSHFCGFDFRVMGSSKAWQMWLPHFPELKPHFTQIERLSNRDMIAFSKCSKLTPVELNPGIVNGLHLRAFESILMGVLPLVERSVDCPVLFPNPSLPLVENRQQARELAEHYLHHEDERIDLVRRLKQYVVENYSTKVRIEAMLHDIGLV